MNYLPKRIAAESISSALERAAHYRLLNQPDLAESIARDVLIVSPEHRGALRELGLALSDQFAELPACFAEVLAVFSRIGDVYETPYLLGIAHERLCRARLAMGTAPETLSGLAEEALRHFAAAEAHRPAGNDDALLRWNSIVRLLARYPGLRPSSAVAEGMDLGDAPPL